MQTWLEIAVERAIVLRAARTSLIVGTALVAINQGDVLWQAGLAAVSWPKALLTYAVPYLVSTHSAVATRRTSGGGV